jgi:hypothetical protein
VPCTCSCVCGCVTQECAYSYISLKYNQKDATFSRSIYLYKLLFIFQAVPPPIIRSTKLYIQRQVLLSQYCCLLLSISSAIAAGSSIGLTIPDAICTVLCSWWWAEEPPETCRSVYRNKQIEKTLHLVGCTLEIYLRCTDIRTSKSFFVCLISLWSSRPCDGPIASKSLTTCPKGFIVLHVNSKV